MNWVAIGVIVELIGAVAVVVTLIYVGVQIRQSTTVARSVARQGVTELMIESSKNLVDDPDLASAFLKDLEGADLDPVERLRIVGRAYLALRHWENIHYQYRTGMLTEDEWRGFRQNLEAIFEWRSMRTAWDNEKQFFSTPFQREVESILAKMPKTPSRLTHAYVLSNKTKDDGHPGAA